jgi:hypothetical protein
MRVLHLKWDLHLKRPKPHMGYFGVTLNVSIAYRVRFSLNGYPNHLWAILSDLAFRYCILRLGFHLRVFKPSRWVILK